MLSLYSSCSVQNAVTSSYTILYYTAPCILGLCCIIYTIDKLVRHSPRTLVFAFVLLVGGVLWLRYLVVVQYLLPRTLIGRYRKDDNTNQSIFVFKGYDKVIIWSSVRVTFCFGLYWLWSGVFTSGTVSCLFLFFFLKFEKVRKWLAEEGNKWTFGEVKISRRNIYLKK